MLKIGLTFSLIFSSFFLPLEAAAQFYTVRKTPTPEYILLPEKNIEVKDTINQAVTDSLPALIPETAKEQYRVARRLPKRKEEQVSKIMLTHYPPLTISNLMKEIKHNGIQHPDIVLAQAILETGWFQSNVCRTKNNLFGLTNPRTGQYYEFDHWTESVKAYYTKVQYRYKGGNYLLWLKKIGYAEAPDYIQSLASILTQYMMD